MYSDDDAYDCYDGYDGGGAYAVDEGGDYGYNFYGNYYNGSDDGGCDDDNAAHKYDSDYSEDVNDKGKTVCLEYDGASKGNPGRAGAGAVLKSEDGTVITRVRRGLGTDTNNAAEYEALNEGMRTAIEMGYDRIHVKGDSQLVHKQVQGEWKTRNPNMARYCREARDLKSRFKSFDSELVPRGSNRDADAEANKAVNLPPGHVEKEGGSRSYGRYY